MSKILYALVHSESVITAAELREATGIPPATLSRQLKQLVDIGYATKVRHGEYAAGPALLALGMQLMERATTHQHLHLLHKLVERTGLNAELYSLVGKGPMLLTWVGGVSEFRVRMEPGHIVSSPGNPATACFLATHPDAKEIWTTPRQEFADAEGWAELSQGGGIILARGYILPELARACMLLPDQNYCLGLSGLQSEFTLTEQDIQTLLSELLSA